MDEKEKLRAVRAFEEPRVTRDEVEDYAIGTMELEIVNTLRTFPVEALYLITYMLKHNDGHVAVEVEEFSLFLRNCCRLLSDEKKKELIEFTEREASDMLREEVNRELASKIHKIIMEHGPIGILENMPKEMGCRYDD